MLFYIRKKAGVQPDQCDLNPEVYDACLKAIFGWGAEIVEKKILECLYLKLEVHLKIKSGFVFIDEVKRAQKLLDSSGMSVRVSSGRMGNGRRLARKALIVNSKGQTF